MAFELEFDKAGEHKFETGVSKGVLYVLDPESQEENKYGNGVAWNGLTSINESPEGAEPTALYADNIKYLNLMSAEDFKGTIECYTYPDEFGVCDGSDELISGVSVGQQTRRMFGLCYRTEIGNDETQTFGYKLHLVYNCLASPSERAHESVNDSPNAETMSWEFSTTPVNIADVNNKKFKPTAHLVVDSTKLTESKMRALEEVLYGKVTSSEGSNPSVVHAKLPLPNEVVTILNSAQ